MKDSQFFYICDQNGGLKQFSINDQSLVNHFDKPNGQEVCLMVKTI